MAIWRSLRLRPHSVEPFSWLFMHLKCYRTHPDWNKLRPMILKRIKNRANAYPIKGMIPVAYEVLKAKSSLLEGVASLLKVFPIKSCRFCSEIYIGMEGHKIRTCRGFKCLAKNLEHRWVDGRLNDILPSVVVFNLRNMFQDVIEHNHRFDFDRVDAVIELCCQAGAELSDEVVRAVSDSGKDKNNAVSSPSDICAAAQETLEAWEKLRLGVHKLLMVYPAKVCAYCSEVHVGPSGHKARLCGIFKYDSWRGHHHWKKADLDDLVPQKLVWHRRPHDPPILLDRGRGFYGHAPAVVELCTIAGARLPNKYLAMMKSHGLAPT